MEQANHSSEVWIIGAGLAGLACAMELQNAGQSFVICEASDRVGGRVATDLHEGYLLDRGFQVLLTAYPEAQRLLNYQKLDLCMFYPGAMVRHAKKWHRVADPFRHPVDAICGVFSPIGSLADKLRVGFARLTGFNLFRDCLNLSSLEALEAKGFSKKMIERFFRPFLSGVFLENRLETSARKLDFVMKNFAKGRTAIPARGMAEIPKQMAAMLPAKSIHLNTSVISISGKNLLLATGETIQPKAIVIATNAIAADRLLGKKESHHSSHSATCLYFSAPIAPIAEAILLLNGEKNGPINNMCVLSEVSPNYAPAGMHLISISVIEPQKDLESSVRKQLLEWFGEETKLWNLLRIDHISEAIPAQKSIEQRSLRIGEGLYQCGDSFGIASINTALESGTNAAKAIAKDFP